MKIESSAFSHDEPIPAEFTCDGRNRIPPLVFLDIPETAQSLVLIMDDPDVPESVRPDRMWDHWLVWNIPPETTVIAAGQEPKGVIGKNTGGEPGYMGPCPPDREHRYFFKLYALDTVLDLDPETAGKSDILSAIKNHILEKAELMGRYNRAAKPTIMSISSSSSKTLKVGFISGFESPYGIVVKNQFKGAELAVAEINAMGGVLEMQVELIPKDDKMKVELAAKAATELIQIDKADLLIGTLSAATATEVNRIAVGAGIPFISINQVSAITEASNMGLYTFHEGFTPYMTAHLVGKWGLEHLGKRWFCLAPDYQWGHESYAAYQTVLKKLGGEDLGVVKFPLGAQPEDFLKHFDAIKKIKPDVLCVTSFGSDQINFIKAAHQAELKKDMSIVLGISEISIADAVSLDEMVGMYWGVNFYWGLEKSIPSAKKFVEAFREKFSDDTPSGYAGYAYSATTEFLLAAKTSGKYPLDYNAMTRFLEGRSYDHYKGAQWWRPCDHQSFQNLYILRFKGPEESKHKYDIGEILDTVEWDLSIERDCQILGHAEHMEGHIQKPT